MTAARDDAVRRLHAGIDPFIGFDPAGWADPTDRWDSHHPYFHEAVESLRPRVIVEVGSFLGASARHFAGCLKAEGLDAVVIAVDTWLAETVLLTSPEWRPHLRITNGRPEAFKVWMANALAAGLADYLCPLPIDSGAGARYLAAQGMVADMVYVDASHIEGDVYRDLTLYWDLVLRPGGLLLADDYQATPDFAGVVRDCDRFADERGLPLEVMGTKARMRKPG